MTTDPRDTVAHDELRTLLFGDLQFTLRTLAQLEVLNEAGMPVSEVWRTVLKVAESACTEHRRLLGEQVGAQEEALLRSGSKPWRALIEWQSNTSDSAGEV